MCSFLRLPDHARFTQEALGERTLLVQREGGELLERDLAVEGRLAGEVHDRHPAASKLLMIS